MRDSGPSLTAMRVAVRRAAHQLLDSPKVFDDPLAVAIAGPDALAEIERGAGDSRRERYARAMRAFMAVRSRYAEDELAAAVDRGVRQYVVLGAGLDTFAYRNRYASAGVRVFEVDHPATQAWKRERLAAAGISIPAEMAYAPVDFERQTVGEGLAKAGFDCEAAAFFSWLGVTPYLTRAAFDATAGYIAALPAGSGVAFDFAVDRSVLSAPEQAALDELANRVAAAGEPFQLFFDCDELTRDLLAMGFRHIEQLAREEINARYFEGRADGLRISGGAARLLCARV